VPARIAGLSQVQSPDAASAGVLRERDRPAVCPRKDAVPSTTADTPVAGSSIEWTPPAKLVATEEFRTSGRPAPESPRELPAVLEQRRCACPGRRPLAGDRTDRASSGRTPDVRTPGDLVDPAPTGELAVRLPQGHDGDVGPEAAPVLTKSRPAALDASVGPLPARAAAHGSLIQLLPEHPRRDTAASRASGVPQRPGIADSVPKPSSSTWAYTLRELEARASH
jgi:hypothetical protein